MAPEGPLPSPLVLATGNPGKRADLAALLEPLGVACLHPDDGLDPAETGDSYVANARIKALAHATRSGHPALADDSGLEVDALGGAPGLHTRRWAESHGGWASAAERLVAEVGEGAAGRYVCALALAWPDGRCVTARGEVPGTLVSPRGRAPSFDPVFVPDGADRTFAEHTDAERRAVDHRRAAFDRLLEAYNTAMRR